MPVAHSARIPSRLMMKLSLSAGHEELSLRTALSKRSRRANATRAQLGMLEAMVLVQMHTLAFLWMGMKCCNSASKHTQTRCSTIMFLRMQKRCDVVFPVDNARPAVVRVPGYSMQRGSCTYYVPVAACTKNIACCEKVGDLAPKWSRPRSFGAHAHGSRKRRRLDEDD